MPDLNALGVAAALGSAATWAIGAFLFKGFGNSLSPLALTLSKGVCSVVMLGLVSLAYGSVIVDDRSMVYLAGAGLLGIAVGDTLFFRALRDLSAFSLLVLCTLGQILNVLLAWLVLDEELKPIMLVGIGLVVGRVFAVLKGTAGEEGGKTRFYGIVYGLLFIVCFSVSNIWTKQGLGPDADTIQATFIKMLAGTLGVLIFGLITRSLTGWLTPFSDRRLLVKFSASVFVMTFGAFWLTTVAYASSSVAVASTLTSTEPIFGLLITVFVLRQRVSWLAVLGAFIAVAGVVLLVVPQATSGIQEFAGWLF